ncbi:ABC transporter substrate-binding protein [Goodfellowiella coeruleoviolacea]|uniref:NitT/TauT family transport system substrate-binding protein n=1 Tax=Goodfellowiella coeruleoviolacea TaxID=334858 RepID=A0AAE3GD14_9PSEU|nr:ABC transporter substrate-binding protein [Goodfellowiella coeruleoviolacea]MCP2165165.1 NitT/TauT family transport system substrate-binding protein [Goodfellowiella coeruleoviolacea]
MRATRRTRLLVTALAGIALFTSMTACSRADGGDQGAPPGQDQGPAAELRLGFFPNVTHAPALIGVHNGFFAKELGSTKLTTQTFNAGPDEINALFGESLDIGFIGSGPAINGFTKSNGEAVRLVAGAVSGGAQLVVRPDITSPQQLVGRTIASPQLGNTQDVALKKWLAGQHLTVGDGPDQVHVTNLDNPKTLDAFRNGEVDGGWLPEPWASRLVLDAGASVLVDEASLWPEGRFPTTVVIVRTKFLQEHPQTVRDFLKGELAAIEWAKANPAEARTAVNEALSQLAGSTLSDPVLERAFAGVTLTPDPLAGQFPQLAEDSVTAGVVTSKADLHGFVNLGPLNEALAANGQPAVDAAGLDTK